MQNPGRPLPKSDEAVVANKRKKALEQYSADRKGSLGKNGRRLLLLLLFQLTEERQKMLTMTLLIIVSHRKQSQNHFK